MFEDEVERLFSLSNLNSVQVELISRQQVRISDSLPILRLLVHRYQLPARAPSEAEGEFY